ncbi:MAG: co-chaperone GroES [Malacoplasma sp.]|nr:co-chaperone GroES [Malacoplasma sp.]MDE5841491.1 co-chaperone GroES [Malacoplasma sp.]MDE6082738.1 co-chaperone GroES [Malacoplasma sp.]MDE6429444.1 co-chaperone GroES [Malacoplasma sp.]MDE6562680.1 co-chaperone GroES [Malacoplasma sp.]
MEFKPLGKRVLLKREEKETKTKTGILLTGSSANEKPSCGVIKAVSKELDSPELTVGTKVYFKEYKANEIKLDGQELLVVEIVDILGIIKE